MFYPIAMPIFPSVRKLYVLKKTPITYLHPYVGMYCFVGRFLADLLTLNVLTPRNSL